MVMRKADVLTAVRICQQAYQKYERRRLERIHAYLAGTPNDLYMPPNARASTEYNSLRGKAVVNYVGLVVDVMAQGLIVEGYRTKAAPGDTPNTAWETWQANQMDKRQTGLNRSAVSYGVAYTTTLPGAADGPKTTTGLPIPAIRPISARNMTALYVEDGDEWPQWALHRVKWSEWRLYDDEARYLLTRSAPGAQWQLERTERHEMQVTPVVRYTEKDLIEGDECPMGLVEPIMSIQDQINEGRLDLLMAQKFAAFRQRWATGMEIPTDPETGEKIEPFKSAVDRLWISEDTETQFGEFDQTDTSGYIAAHDTEVKDVAAISQVAAQHLLGPTSNMSAEALAAAEAGQMRRSGEIKTNLGESYEQNLRLAAMAAGDQPAAADTSSEVDWRDVESRSLAQVADALTKIAVGLGVPVELLWEKIPGWTQGDIDRAKSLRTQGSALDRLAGVLGAQAGTTPVPGSPAAPAPATLPNGQLTPEVIDAAFGG